MATRKTRPTKARPKKAKHKKKTASPRRAKPTAKAAKARASGKPKPAPKAAKAKPAAGQAKAAPAPKGKPEAKGKVPTAAPKGAAGKTSAAPEGAKPARPSGRKSSRRPTLLRRGPDGEILAPGDLLLPGGAQRAEEVQYLLRGCEAAEHPAGEEGIAEVFAKRPAPETPGEREEMGRTLSWARERFGRGSIEPVIPPRTNLRRTFQGVVERARHRRREIGAFLRGLDLGRTETSHMDAHGEASLQSLMEWAARLENLAEADEPNQADYGQFHRGLDQLESTTEALIIDVEQTLRRLRDRLRA
jgi:hypothetical protein